MKDKEIFICDMISKVTPERKLWVERKNSLKYVSVIGYIKLVCFFLKTLDTGKKNGFLYVRKEEA